MMSLMSKREYLRELKKKYSKASRKEKGQLLDDFCTFTGYHRKHAITLINATGLPPKKKQYKSRQKVYGQLVIEAIRTLWKAANEICAERLHPFIPSLSEKLIACNELIIDQETHEKLLKISLATVKRILSNTKHKTSFKVGGTTKPGTLLKKQIAIRFGPWIDTDPGWCETDTVSHCGDSASGTFISSLNVIDICLGWSEQAAIMGKGEKATQEQIDVIRSRLPVPLLGLDPDNGSEFINWHLYRYCKKENINLTRSRPYKKNDNAHVEQKNYTAIRQLVGYFRFDTQQQLDILNDLYANEWRLYMNFFQPTMKLKEKVTDRSTKRTKRIYYPAQTPYQRLLDHPKVSKETKAMLKSIYEDLNPIQLQRGIQRKLKKLMHTLE